MTRSPDQLFILILGLLTFAYVLIALLRGKAHGLQQLDGWAIHIHTTADIFTFPLLLSIYMTLGALLTLLGSRHADLLLSEYLIFSGFLALLARSVAIWFVSYAVVFFLSQVRRIFS
jgi:hypothetical protein